MHKNDANKTYGEKAWRRLHMKAASNIKQVLDAAPHKAAAFRPLTTYLENYQNLDEPDMPDTAEK